MSPRWYTIVNVLTIKGFFVALLFLLASDYIKAQNLIKNPSFECGNDPCSETIYLTDLSQFACHWSEPNAGSTDIFSTEAPADCYSAMPNLTYHLLYPFAYAGFQMPRTGKRFAGIYTFSDAADTPWLTYREYLEVELEQPLVPGELYCVEMYSSLGEACGFAANNLGMAFVDSQYYLFDSGVLPLVASFTESDIMSDSVNWVRSGGTLRATSAAKFLIIGNFTQDAETAVIRRPYPGYYNYTAYYFIDDISVLKLPHAEFIISGNQEICQGDETTIHAEVGIENVNWSNLEDPQTVLYTGATFRAKPTVTTSYLISASVTSATCNVLVQDTVTIIVNPVPDIKLGTDTTLCVGKTLLLNAGQGYKGYSWQDGSSNPYFTVTSPGEYSVIVSNQFDCRKSDSLKVSGVTVPQFDLGKDSVVCSAFYPLRAGGATSYRWSSGSSDSVLLPQTGGNFWVTVENQCGQTTDSVSVYSYAKAFFPNVITPNADELNQTFRIGFVDDAKIPVAGILIPGQMKIINRWGTEVYSKYPYTNDWPASGEDIPPGTYYFLFTYAGCPSTRGWIEVRP